MFTLFFALFGTKEQYLPHADIISEALVDIVFTIYEYIQKVPANLYADKRLYFEIKITVGVLHALG